MHSVGVVRAFRSLFVPGPAKTVTGPAFCCWSNRPYTLCFGSGTTTSNPPKILWLRHEGTRKQIRGCKELLGVEWAWAECFFLFGLTWKENNRPREKCAPHRTVVSDIPPEAWEFLGCTGWHLGAVSAWMCRHYLTCQGFRLISSYYATSLHSIYTFFLLYHTQ